ncbi:MAG: DUF4296 domain-containing protein [Haliscomenobacteraceae bacterium CHB4]|nr:hypothetical protein [Saprospiraceae bacterium]MCE7923728.1 DUF4296 domain-containing protein [Haliscomenobacteraceae bacterium CHB4]
MKRLSVIGFWLSFALFLSCKEKTEQPALPDEQISKIMADLFVAEAATNGLTGYTKDSLMQVYFKQVLEMHKVTKEAYEKELRLRIHDLKRMEAIVKDAEALLETGKK